MISFARKKASITPNVPKEEPKGDLQKVEIFEIKEILPHSNADRLEFALIEGWTCVVGKGQFQVGNLALYIPVDSVLPDDVENILFPPGSKITLHKHRVRSIKIRGQLSQGMLVTPEQIGIYEYKVGDSFAEKLDIRKYEPPEPKFQSNTSGNQVSKKNKNPYFKEYTDIQHFKWYKNLFEQGEIVFVTEKIHGCNFRAGWVPFVPRTFWDKVKYFLKITKPYEFVYGSRRVQLQYKKKYKGYYDDNIYLEMVKKYDLEKRIPEGYVVYGEVYGDGIQKNYNYGCVKGERKLALFDIQEVGKDYNTYLNTNHFQDIVEYWGLPKVPVLYEGPYEANLIHRLANTHPSTLCSEQKIKEGVIIKPAYETQSIAGRKVLKYISDSYYLDKNNSDFH